MTATTTDEAAFLRAIDARPGDPLPLLVWADWLDEQGRPGEAEGLRWCADYRRAPQNYGRIGWGWWGVSFMGRQEPTIHTLPYQLLRAMPGQSWSGDQHRAAGTYAEAFALVGAAFAAGRAAGTDPLA